jgi:catechol 2,3-dioxygenase
MPLPSYSQSNQTRIGHVHLKVSHLERSIAFYQEVMGFTLTQRFGQHAAFLSAGGYHHHIGLNTWDSLGGAPAAPGHPGLYHAAILVPSRADLALFLRHLLSVGHPLDGAADHGVSHALYLRDPDENGLEVYWDVPETDWPRDQFGALQMFSRALDLDELLESGPRR